jgi:hypothetical protein
MTVCLLQEEVIAQEICFFVQNGKRHFEKKSGYRSFSVTHSYTKSHSLANFVGCIAGFLDASIIRLRNLLLAVALSFECNLVLFWLSAL